MHGPSHGWGAGQRLWCHSRVMYARILDVVSSHRIPNQVYIYICILLFNLYSIFRTRNNYCEKEEKAWAPNRAGTKKSQKGDHLALCSQQRRYQEEKMARRQTHRGHKPSTLIGSQFPNLAGLQPPEYRQDLSFPIIQDPFVQILHVSGNHWITVAGASPSVVLILCDFGNHNGYKDAGGINNMLRWASNYIKDPFPERECVFICCSLCYWPGTWKWPS